MWPIEWQKEWILMSINQSNNDSTDITIDMRAIDAMRITASTTVYIERQQLSSYCSSLLTSINTIVVCR
jgi:hypothetical protein